MVSSTDTPVCASCKLPRVIPTRRAHRNAPPGNLDRDLTQLAARFFGERNIRQQVLAAGVVSDLGEDVREVDLPREAEESAAGGLGHFLEIGLARRPVSQAENPGRAGENLDDVQRHADLACVLQNTGMRGGAGIVDTVGEDHQRALSRYTAELLERKEDRVPDGRAAPGAHVVDR